MSLYIEDTNKNEQKGNTFDDNSSVIFSGKDIDILFPKDNGDLKKQIKNIGANLLAKNFMLIEYMEKVCKKNFLFAVCDPKELGKKGVDASKKTGIVALKCILNDKVFYTVRQRISSLNIKYDFCVYRRTSHNKPLEFECEKKGEDPEIFLKKSAKILNFN